MATKKSPANPSRRNNNKLTLVNSTVSVLTTAATDTHYIDVAELLSEVNRKLFSSEYCYGIESLRFSFPSNQVATTDLVNVIVATAGDTWSVHNAWTKGRAMHHDMQQLVLADNPSILGRWSDFKVYMDVGHVGATNLRPFFPDGSVVSGGSWEYSTYVIPQNDVDPVTGEPLVADETTAHLVGDDIPGAIPGYFASVGLVKAYAESRRTVQPTDLIPGQADGFFNILTDSGSQEPELAAVIELENNEPPYSQFEYPGGVLNASTGFFVSAEQVSKESPNGEILNFNAQCGIIRLTTQAWGGDMLLAPPVMRIDIKLKLGKYKGVHALPMGQ